MSANPVLSDILGIWRGGAPLRVEAKPTGHAEVDRLFPRQRLNAQPMGFYSPAQLVNDARHADVVFRPGDVMYSDWDCKLERGDAGVPEARWQSGPRPASLRTVSVAGTASGVVFRTLEDETGTTNLIFWSKVFNAQREVIVGARLMMVEGKLQSEQGVINVVAHDVQDCPAWLENVPTRSRDFQ